MYCDISLNLGCRDINSLNLTPNNLSSIRVDIMLERTYSDDNNEVNVKSTEKQITSNVVGVLSGVDSRSNKLYMCSYVRFRIDDVEIRINGILCLSIETNELSNEQKMRVIKSVYFELFAFSHIYSLIHITNYFSYFFFVFSYLFLDVLCFSDLFSFSNISAAYALFVHVNTRVMQPTPYRAYTFSCHCSRCALEPSDGVSKPR